MSFDSLERSQQGAGPAELYDFVTPLTTFRLTTFQSDVVYLGNTYTATTGARSNISVPDLATDQADITISIPATHTLAKAYANGIPMRDLLVTLTRAHLPTMVVSQFWQGYASGIAFDDTLAIFRVPSGMNDALATDVPSVVAQKLCNHVLYDARCTINPGTGYTVTTTIAAISADGRTFTLASPTPAPTATVISGVATTVPWALHGQFTHSPTNERRTITDQTSTTVVTVQAQFPNGSLHVGDLVVVLAGCDHSMPTCASAKFNNGVNHGGHPYMLPSNIFYLGLLGSRLK